MHNAQRYAMRYHGKTVYHGMLYNANRNDIYNSRLSSMPKLFHTININEDVSGQLIYPATGKC